MDGLISRRAAIDAVRHSPIIEVQPAYMLIDKADVLKNLVMVPSAQPERKTGRWMTEYLDGIPGRRAEIKYCSECCQVSQYRHKFCPNCGCAMKGEEE